MDKREKQSLIYTLMILIGLVILAGSVFFLWSPKKFAQYDDAKYGFELTSIDVYLFEKDEELDVSILDKPVAKIAFDNATGYINYDAAYTKSIQKELERLKNELAERLKAREDNRKKNFIL